jgi:succinate dehydrogenase / fumarate reductase cytochrome b subunit
MAVETAERPTARTTHQETVESDSRFQRYKIRTGMFAWMAHRLSGVGLVAYLIVHVWGLKSLTDPAAFNALIAKYHAPIFKVGEFFLLAAVVYHAINGLRIVLIDFLGWSPKQKKLFWTLGAVAVVLIMVGGWPSIYALGEWMLGPGSMPSLFL